MVDDFAVYGEQFSYGHSCPKVVQYNEISDIRSWRSTRTAAASRHSSLDDAAAKINALLD